MKEKIASKLVGIAEEVRKLVPGSVVTIIARDPSDFGDGDHVFISSDTLSNVIRVLEDLQKKIGD